MPDMGEKPRVSLKEELIPRGNEDFWTVDLTIHPGTHYSVSVGRDSISRIVIYERRLSEISIGGPPEVELE